MSDKTLSCGSSPALSLSLFYKKMALKEGATTFLLTMPPVLTPLNTQL